MGRELWSGRHCARPRGYTNWELALTELTGWMHDVREHQATEPNTVLLTRNLRTRMGSDLHKVTVLVRGRDGT